MTEWVKVRTESLMDDSNKWDGTRIHGFEYYLKQIIENQIKLNEILNGLILDEYKDEE